ITALGADSPEISSAISALMAGEHQMGIGVVLGSNLFNLAALLGLSPFLTRRIALGRAGVVFNGAASLLITGITALLLLKLVGPALAMVLLVVSFACYVMLVWFEVIHDETEETRRESSSEPKEREPHRRGLVITLLIAGALLLIVFGSMGLVRTSVRIARALNVPRALAGALGIAALTGFPNAYTAARLARSGQGAAVVSETLNSNTLNLVFGIGLPTLLLGASPVTTSSLVELGGLLGLTLVATGWAALERGLSRVAGGLIIALYAAFVAVRIGLG
ncbi:MAG TPA: hypothetical protein VMI54_11765, partial [Polyangiaceae bacterium]|nr:hypothetical protein [Polyangiaceae bacterium]